MNRLKTRVCCYYIVSEGSVFPDYLSNSVQSMLSVFGLNQVPYLCAQYVNAIFLT